MSEQLFIGKITLAGTVHCCIQHAAECDNEWCLFSITSIQVCNLFRQ